ncbi:LysM peptidoglycan-binding domain-containing protein [Kineococcus sp. SYSU DK004]|uniref:LysM peptidoglycan-binding domain-containing protein n=1 Tax=Kineococcus sp. SYSU DK004 TaxID=3383125 RepID=UPI003D7EAFFB
MSATALVPVPTVPRRASSPAVPGRGRPPRPGRGARSRSSAVLVLVPTGPDCHRAPVPAPRRPAPAPRAVRRPLRLTRRGRLALTTAAATLLTCTAVAAVGAATDGGPAPARVPHAPLVTAASAAPVTVTVLPGQTLSQIAAQWAPDADWREVAARIVVLNDLPSHALQAGQRLSLPVLD